MPLQCKFVNYPIHCIELICISGPFEQYTDISINCQWIISILDYVIVVGPGCSFSRVDRCTLVPIVLVIWYTVETDRCRWISGRSSGDYGHNDEYELNELQEITVGINHNSDIELTILLSCWWCNWSWVVVSQMARSNWWIWEHFCLFLYEMQKSVESVNK